MPTNATHLPICHLREGAGVVGVIMYGGVRVRVCGDCEEHTYVVVVVTGRTWLFPLPLLFHDCCYNANQ